MRSRGALAYPHRGLRHVGVTMRRLDPATANLKSLQRTALNVPLPCLLCAAAWKVAWLVGNRALPLLHWRDSCNVTDTNVNLWVSWLKAIGGNSPSGPDDSGLAYELLPSFTRRVVSRPLAWAYPLLHHQNIALRTAYLDAAVESALAAAAATAAAAGVEAPPPPPPVVIVLGAGFDLRPLRLRSAAAASARWAELDLPHVVAQKSALRARLLRRRPQLAARGESVQLIGANLSVASEARGAIAGVLCTAVDSGKNAEGAEGGEGGEAGEGGGGGGTCGAAIFVLEALLIYLDPAAAAELLRACAEEAAAAGAPSATVCFADRLPGVAGASFEAARQALAELHLELDEDTWLPKPGLARHMGVARSVALSHLGSGTLA